MARIITAAIALAAVTAIAAPALFTSKAPYDPLVIKLKASGGDSARIIRVRSGQDLLRCDSKKRYKFALDQNGVLAIAPLPADAPNNEYVHPILVNGAPVRTAGGIVIDHANGKIAKVMIDQDSRSYCPSFQSLDEAAHALETLGIAMQMITRQDRPPHCAH